jgi:F-type H+-transporting ATPase subunit alpha
MDDVPVEKIKEFETGLVEYAETNAKVFYKEVAESKMWTDKGEEELKKAVSDFKASFK